MRIFYCLHSHNWEEHNLQPALEELGHELVPFDWGEGAIWKRANWESEGKPRLNEELLAAVRAEHAKKPIDLFFGYLNKFIVFPETVKELKKFGFPTVNFSCNDAHQFYIVDDIAPHFDYCMMTIRHTIPYFKAVGANPVYIQLAANPKRYAPHDLPKIYDVTFLGQRYGDREAYLRYAADRGLAVKAFGTGWGDNPTGAEQLARKFSGGAVGGLARKLADPKALASFARRNAAFLRRVLTGEISRESRKTASIVGGTTDLPAVELAKIFSQSKVTLGLLTCGNTHLEKPIKQIRVREFEAPMSGAFYLTEYMDELEAFYEIGSEIVCYRSKEELVDKARYYLEHESEREKIAEAGHRRALRDHTWVKRFQQLFKEIGV